MKMFHTKLMLQAYDYYTLTIATMPVKQTHNYGYMNTFVHKEQQNKAQPNSGYFMGCTVYEIIQL